MDGQALEFAALIAEHHHVEHGLGQSLVRLGVDPHCAQGGAAGDGAAAIAGAVRDAADDAGRPHRLAVLAARDRLRRDAEARQCLAGQGAAGGELGPSRCDGPDESGRLLGQDRVVGAVRAALGNHGSLRQEALDHVWRRPVDTMRTTFSATLRDATRAHSVRLNRQIATPIIARPRSRTMPASNTGGRRQPHQVTPGSSVRRADSEMSRWLNTRWRIGSTA